MKQLIIILLALLPLLFTNCKGSKERRIEIETAQHMGHVQAIEFDEKMQLDTLTLETMLIDVSSKEATLRRHGHDKVADAYVESFLSTLDSVNPALSDMIRAAR